jgi:hypothetical protein
MRQRMMRIRHADLGVGPVARLARQLERDDPGHVTLQRQHLQIEHQLRVVGVRSRHAGGTIEIGQRLIGRARFRLLNPPFDLPNRVEVLADAGAIFGAEPRLQPRDVVAHRIEQARAPLQLRPTVGRAAAFAEQTLEHDARMRFSR